MLTDERGSVVAEVNDSGTVTDTYAYDEFGVPDAANGNPGNGGHSRLQYAGRPWLAGSETYSNRNRNYHPGLGRFLTRDPIGQAGGLNIYNYTGSDPINFTDPLGLSRGGIDCVRNPHDCITVTEPRRPRYPCRGVCYGRDFFDQMRRDMIAAAAEMMIKSMNVLDDQIRESARHAAVCVVGAAILNQRSRILGLPIGPTQRRLLSGLAGSSPSFNTAVVQVSAMARAPASTASAGGAAYFTYQGSPGSENERFSFFTAIEFGASMPDFDELMSNPRRFLGPQASAAGLVGVSQTAIGDFGNSAYFTFQGGVMGLGGGGFSIDGNLTIMAGLIKGYSGHAGITGNEYQCSF